MPRGLANCSKVVGGLQAIEFYCHKRRHFYCVLTSRQQNASLTEATARTHACLMTLVASAPGVAWLQTVGKCIGG